MGKRDLCGSLLFAKHHGQCNNYYLSLNDSFCRMAEYVRGEPERKRARKEELKRKIEEKLELADRPARKHRFEDAKFFDESEEQVEEVKSAVAAAIKESLKAGSTSPTGASSSSSSGSDSKGKGKAKKQDSDDEDVVVKKKAVKSLGMW